MRKLLLITLLLMLSGCASTCKNEVLAIEGTATAGGVVAGALTSGVDPVGLIIDASFTLYDLFTCP